MKAMPQPDPDTSAPDAAIVSDDRTSRNGTPVAEPETPPPHRLWATLESAYAAAEQGDAVDRGKSPDADDERLALTLALPLAIGLSLVLWVVIVELVLMR